MSKRSNRLIPGRYPLSYGGVRSDSSILIFSTDRRPTVNDTAYLIGTMWIDSTQNDTYILVDLSAGVATWIILAAADASAIEFTCDTGSAIAAGGILNFIGDGNLLVTGSGNSMEVGLVQGFDGQIFIGSDSGPMALANITAGTGITITNGSNTISIEDNGGGGVIDLSTDSGTATPVADNIQIAGGTNITTVAAGDTVTVNLNTNVTLAGTMTVSAFGVGVLFTDPSGVVSSDPDSGFNGTVIIGDSAGSPAWGDITSPAGTLLITKPGTNTIDIRNAGSTGIDSIATDSGTATKAAGNINIYGGTNISTTAASNHVDVALDSNVTLSGTLTLPWTNGVLWTDPSGVVNSSNGSDGETLIGGDTSPVWDTISSSTLTITNGTNSIEIADENTQAITSFSSVLVGNFGYWNVGSGFTANAVWQYFGPGDGAGDIISDTNSNWSRWNSPSTPYFTAPITGKYLFQVKFSILAAFGRLIGKTYVIYNKFGVKFITTSQDYISWERYYNETKAPLSYDEHVISFDIICSMDAGDSAEIQGYVDYSGIDVPIPYNCPGGSFCDTIGVTASGYSGSSTWINCYLIN